MRTHLLHVDRTGLVGETIAKWVLGTLQPSIDPPGQTIAGMLGILDATESGCHDIGLIGPEISIEITGVDEMRRFDEENPIMGGGDRPWKNQILEKRHGSVHASVVVIIDQNDDSADGARLVASIDVVHVSTHLDDPETTGGVETHRDRILDQWFARDQFHLEAGREREGFKLLLGGTGR